MEGTENYSLCILCCYSFPSSPQQDRKENRAKSVKLVDKFIRQTGGELAKGLSSAGLLNQPDMSLCGECLSVVTKAAEKREQAEEVEVEVRQLQQEILGMLRKLGGLMDDYVEEMRRIENMIRCSDENCLRAKFQGRRKQKGNKKAWVKETVHQFRNEILNAAKEWTSFRNDLSSTHMNVPSTQTRYFADAQVECKVEQENDNQCGNPNQEPAMEFENLVTIEKDPLQDDPLATSQQLSSNDKQSTSDSQLSTETSNLSNPANPDKPYPCPKCKQCLTTANRLKVHLLNKHPPGPPGKLRKKKKWGLGLRVNCADCGRLIRPVYLPTHKISCMALQPNWRNTCSHCSERFGSVDSFNQHLLQVHGEKAAKPVLTCDVCGKGFHTKQNLQRHKETHLPPEERPKPEKFSCKFCGKILLVTTNFRQHTRYHCSGIPKEIEKDCVCHKCGKVFNNRRSLNIHLHSVCIPPGDFRCQFCGRQGFKTRSSLNQHEKQHKLNKERPFLCGRCGGNFNRREHLRRHEKRCDGTKKPRKPRWSNMLQTVANEPGSTSAGGGNGEGEGSTAKIGNS